MKKVLLIALFVTVALANSGWAQTPDARPSTVQPGTLAILDFLQAPAAQPAPARPATAPAAPSPPSAARPAPAPPAVPATAAPLPPQGVAPPAVPAPAAQLRINSFLNVRFDVTITDTGGAKPVTKTMSLTIGTSNNNGSVRQTAQAPNPTPGPPTIPVALNVDVRNVTWMLDPTPSGRDAAERGIRATVAVEYQPYLPDAKTQPGMVVANATSVFVDGRRTQILVTSDPVSDRKTTIEVTATILK
jgi:hypothetical protein